MEYLRATEISMYLDCSAKYYFAKVEKIEFGVTPLALATGIAIHNVLEKNYSQKINTKVDLSTEEILDITNDELVKNLKEVDKSDFIEETPDEVRDNGLFAMGMYHKNVAPKIQPKIVERRITVEFDGFELGLTGKFDLVDSFDDMVDHKTTKKTPTDVPHNYILQHSSYNILAEADGIPIRKHRNDFIIVTNNPAIKHFQVVPDRNMFYAIFEQVVKGILHGVFIPNRSSNFCTRRFCKFWDSCEKRYGGRVRQ